MKPISLLLFVPLAWAACGAADPAPDQPPTAHGWRQSQKEDAARSMSFTRFTLAGKFVASPKDAAANRPELVVDCIPGSGSHPSKGKFLAANLVVGTNLKILYVEPEEIHGTSYFPKVAIRFRADDAKEENDQWSSGTERTSASIPKDSLKKILHVHTVALTADDDRGSKIAMQFDMPDPTPVEAGCNVDEH